MDPIIRQLTHADVEKILRLVELLHGSNLQFIRLEADGLEITISRGDAAAPGVAIPSPGVGVFRADAAQGLGVGSLVEAATALGCVQTLDEMNCVTAGMHGRIVEHCARGGAFVEFGQPLYRVLPITRG